MSAFEKPLYENMFPSADDLARTQAEAAFLTDRGYYAVADAGTLWVTQDDAVSCSQILDDYRHANLSIPSEVSAGAVDVEILGFPVYIDQVDDLYLAMIQIDYHEIICGSGTDREAALSSAIRNSPSISSSHSIAEKARVAHRRDGRDVPEEITAPVPAPKPIMHKNQDVTFAEVLCSEHDLKPGSVDCVSRNYGEWWKSILESESVLRISKSEELQDVFEPGAAQDDAWSQNTVRYEFHDGSAIVMVGNAESWDLGVHKTQVDNAALLLKLADASQAGLEEADKIIMEDPPRELGLFAMLHGPSQENLAVMHFPDAVKVNAWRKEHERLLADLNDYDNRRPDESSAEYSEWLDMRASKAEALESHLEKGHDNGTYTLEDELIDTVWVAGQSEQGDPENVWLRADPVDHTGRYSVKWIDGLPGSAVLVPFDGVDRKSMLKDRIQSALARNMAMEFHWGGILDLKSPSSLREAHSEWEAGKEERNKGTDDELDIAS